MPTKPKTQPAAAKRSERQLTDFQELICDLAGDLL